MWLARGAGTGGQTARRAAWCGFFVASRSRHTRCLSDWSSDVCSSDLCRSYCSIAYTGTGPTALAMLQYERQRNLFLQGRRLIDEYRFGANADLWQAGSEALLDPGTFLPITINERIANSYFLGNPTSFRGR